MSAPAIRPDIEERLTWVAQTEPWSITDDDDRLAFLINAYNLSVLGLVQRFCQNSPRFSRRGLSDPFNFIRFFLLSRVVVGGRRISLYLLENRWLRRRFSEPRIHFALNCASASCPPLKEGLYRGESLNDELEMATQNFLSSPSGVQLDREEGVIRLSRIFKWYARDFGGIKGVIAFIAEKLPETDRDWFLDSHRRIEWMPYDWSLV